MQVTRTTVSRAAKVGNPVELKVKKDNPLVAVAFRTDYCRLKAGQRCSSDGQCESRHCSGARCRRVSMTQHNGYDRRGSDYRSISYAYKDRGRCSKSCAADPKCKAFTVVYASRLVKGHLTPVIDASKPVRCYLKSAVPGLTRNPMTFSGVKVLR